MDSHACDGCLGTRECWICTGQGCRRCHDSGSCHVCVLPRVIHLVPPQREDTARAPGADAAGRAGRA